MMISDAFPSAFLQADDLKGKAVTVTIAEATMEDIGKNKDNKLVLRFRGKDKKLIVNKTNAKVIAKLHGDDTDDWVGKQIRLVPREVEFQGDMVWAIRVSLEAPNGKAAPERHDEPETPPAESDPDWDAEPAGF